VRELRILVVDARAGVQEPRPASALPDLLERGDLVVLNDAATLPASLAAHTQTGEPVELRLVGGVSPEGSSVHFTAALLGSGDYRTRTEDRPPPSRVAVGDELAVGGELVARVLAFSSLSERLLHVQLGLRDPFAERARVWAALYRAGTPVQYAHVPAPLALWDVQNLWAARPWAVEMPSAGRVIDARAMAALRARGVAIVTVTHAAGLSATGHPEIDALLPLPERFEVPESAARAVTRARARGGRVLAVGTSVVRALESAARASGDGALHGAAGTTDLLLGPGAPRALVDGVLTGVHESDTTHFALLGAFASRDVLAVALETAEREGLLGHELGDAWLVWGDPATRAVARPQSVVDGALGAPSPCSTSATVAA
jgi:S-adenosylmethionine:tRNA ribosyltransferase-isomerase